MKMKKCPQCKNLISEIAPTCLYCGRPNKFVTNNYVKKKWDKNLKKSELNIFKLPFYKEILIIFIFLIILTICLSI